MNHKQYSAIAEHGKNLLAIFPATEDDPVLLCKKLRRLENAASAITIRMCNGPEFAEDEADRKLDAILLKVDKLLNFSTAGIPVFVNRDPRGYALKIQDEYVRKHQLKLHSDWGGYGILAPEITGK